MNERRGWLFWMPRIQAFAKFVGAKSGDVYPILSAKDGHAKAWYVHDLGFYRMDHPATWIGKLDEGWVGFIMGRAP